MMFFSYQKTFKIKIAYRKGLNQELHLVTIFLPKNLAKRDFSEVPQKKRKEWLIRHNHLENLNKNIKKFLINNSLSS